MVSLRLGPKSLGSNIKSFLSFFCGARLGRTEENDDGEQNASVIRLCPHEQAGLRLTYQVEHSKQISKEEAATEVGILGS